MQIPEPEAGVCVRFLSCGAVATPCRDLVLHVVTVMPSPRGTEGPRCRVHKACDMYLFPAWVPLLTLIGSRQLPSV